MIRSYLVENFPDSKVLGDEFTIPSIFYDDHKKHLSINLDTGLWQDFKSGHSGNFSQFVAYHTGLPPEFVLSRFKASVFTDGKKLKEYLLSEFKQEITENPNPVITIEDELKTFTPVNHAKVYSNGRNYEEVVMSNAATFLATRGLAFIDALVATTGKYSGRVIIPFGTEYFVARTVIKQTPRYFNPKENEYGVKSSDVLYPFDRHAGYVIVCEGVFDALTLKKIGLNATSIQGTNLSTSQIRKLKKLDKVVIALDGDEAGIKGTKKVYDALVKGGFTGDIHVCHPPTNKDWNEMYKDAVFDGTTLLDYFMKNTKPFNYKHYLTISLNLSL